MAVRQYIGARYMPKFSEHNGGDWDNTYTYEALEIVKYGNDYYTAKKAVPTLEQPDMMIFLQGLIMAT